MKYSSNAMSAILLCSHIGIKDESNVKPFSIGEWNVFLERLSNGSIEPGQALKPGFDQILLDLGYSSCEINRINKLTGRGGVAALEMDELSRKGIELITQFDSGYPKLLKKRLKKKQPPVLFFSGDISLSNKIGIAIVGSRNINSEGIEFTKELVRKAAREHFIIYSGGAKGVDFMSEKTAIESGSAVVSYIADSLLSKIKKREVIESIQQSKLLLFSDVKPDVGFSAARAMNRNKYIYASSYGAFVVAADYNKGGTWGGAIENLKNGWVKTMVWENPNFTGNEQLIIKGGIPYDLNAGKLYDVVFRKEKEYVQENIFHSKAMEVNYIQEFSAGKNRKDKEKEKIGEETDIFYVIEEYLTEQFKKATTVDEVCERLNVAKGQMRAWLKRLCKEGKLRYESGKYIAS